MWVSFGLGDYSIEVIYLGDATEDLVTKQYSYKNGLEAAWANGRVYVWVWGNVLQHQERVGKVPENLQ